jgi:hypothetical protein
MILIIQCMILNLNYFDALPIEEIPSPVEKDYLRIGIFCVIAGLG